MDVFLHDSMPHYELEDYTESGLLGEGHPLFCVVKEGSTGGGDRFL